MAVEFKTRGWLHNGEGWLFEVRAVTTAGRIIARATANLSYDDAHDVQHYLGPEAIIDIERATAEACARLVPTSEA
jgi:hypothetical protein